MDDFVNMVNSDEVRPKVPQRAMRRDVNFSKALTAAEWKKYNNTMISGVDAGLRINDHSLLVECEGGDYAYKLVTYDNTFEENPVKSVYGIGNDDYSSTTIHEVAGIISDLEDMGYGRNAFTKILKSTAKVHNILLGRYNGTSFTIFGKSGKSFENRTDIEYKSDGAGVPGADKEAVNSSDVQYARARDEGEYDWMDDNTVVMKSKLRSGYSGENRQTGD